MSDVLKRLDAAIAARREAGDAKTSHTAAMLARGPLKCAEKFGEEAVEAVIAAAADDREALVAETADALYHLLVMLASRDVTLAEALAALEAREGVSGVAEKASRGDSSA